jgi:hypothetical protein
LGVKPRTELFLSASITEKSIYISMIDMGIDSMRENFKNCTDKLSEKDSDIIIKLL